MEVTRIHGAARTLTGRNKVARVRAAGQVPAVVYGGDKGPAHIALDGAELGRELRHNHRVFELEFEGAVESVYLQDVQVDVLSDETLHVDFKRIDLTKPMQVEVELTFIGIPKGVAKGAALVRDRSTLHIASLPAAMPREIEVRIGGLDVGDALYARDLQLPEGVTLNVPEDMPICHLPGEEDE